MYCLISLVVEIFFVKISMKVVEINFEGISVNDECICLNAKIKCSMVCGIDVLNL